jgi:hypothetical protein
MSIRSRLLVLAASAFGAAALAPAAPAAWSPLVRLPASGGAGAPVVATNARGDVAVGWLRGTTQRNATTSLRVAVRRGPIGRFSTHTLLQGRGIALTGLTLALDRRGELTVAWAQRAAVGGSATHPTAVRAAFRTAGGRWSVNRRVTTVSPFNYALPHLAVRPDRSVLLAFNAGIPSAPGVGFAWRRPGHVFTRARSLKTGPRGSFLDLQTGVDAAGRAYVAGVRDCASGRSTGVLYVAPPARARFVNGRIVAPAPVRDLHVAVDPAGGAALTWLAEGCSTTESLPGAVQALRATPGGAPIGAPATVAPSPALELSLSRGPGGSAEVGWTTFGPTAPDGVVRIARSDGSGVFGAPLAPPDGWVAVAADAAGDQLVENPPPASNGFASRAAVRTPDGAVSVSPLRPRFLTAGATVLPSGRGVAVATATPSGVRVTAWRP